MSDSYLEVPGSVEDHRVFGLAGMFLIGVSNVIAIKITSERSLVIISLIANILGLEIASFNGAIHIKLLWGENIYC